MSFLSHLAQARKNAARNNIGKREACKLAGVCLEGAKCDKMANIFVK